MNLAIITSGFLPVPAVKGGAVENLVENFIKVNEKEKRINTTIFGIYDDKAIAESKKYESSSFIFIKINPIVKMFDKITYIFAKKILKKQNSQSYRYIFQRLAYLNKVSKYLKKNDYDKVLLENHPTQYLALKWRKNYVKYDGRYYYHCHNEFPGKYGCDEVINKTKKFICVSKFISNSLQKYLGLPAEKFEVLRNAIDESKFNKNVLLQEKSEIKKKYNIDDDAKILIFTGRIVKEKGIEELINSLKFVKYENYKLLVVGASLNDIKVKTNFEERIEKLVEDVKDKIVFTGFVKYEEISKLYHIADVAVLPSVWDDPAPLTIIESLICGLPIITTNSGGIPEYVNDSCAVILKRDEKLVENIAIEIDKLLIDEEKRSAMASEAKKVADGLKMKKYYDEFIEIIEKW